MIAQRHHRLFQLRNGYPPPVFSHEYILAQSGKINEFSPLIEIITDRQRESSRKKIICFVYPWVILGYYRVLLECMQKFNYARSNWDTHARDSLEMAAWMDGKWRWLETKQEFWTI